MDKKRQELVQRIKTMLQNPATFPDGKLPPERELAAKLGASRNLLREALITLEALGFIEIRDRLGAFILNPYAEDFMASLKFVSLWPDDMLIQVMEMRVVVEVPIAGLAALRRTEDELEKMKQCLNMLVRVHTDPDGGASQGAQWDSMLHMLIVQAAHNPLLTRLYEGLSATMERYISMSRTKLLALEGWPSKIVDEHASLVRAIEAADEDAAREAQRQHLQSALQMLKTLSSRS
ncbi:MAG: FCD domain-containing protein [Rectinema sp.]|nr:FCD domain-containing protein [Rectinema sp.]